MAEPVRTKQTMTVEEFLTWDDGTDQRYELVEGEIVAMALPSNPHGTIVINIGSYIRGRLKPPCRVIADAGIKPHERNDAFYQADLAVTCAPPVKDSQTPEPILVIEVLSKMTAQHDRGTKVPDYQNLPSLQEILLVSSMERRVQHWRRSGDEWIVRMVRGRAVELAAISVSLTLDEIYEGSGVD